MINSRSSWRQAIGHRSVGSWARGGWETCYLLVAAAAQAGLAERLLRNVANDEVGFCQDRFSGDYLT
jgi:hypothetical protein